VLFSCATGTANPRQR